MALLHRALLFVIVATTLVSPRDGAPLVLCFEPDGAVRIEEAVGGRCGDRDAREPDGAPTEVPTVSDAGCCPCTDIPLPATGTATVSGAGSASSLRALSPALAPAPVAIEPPAPREGGVAHAPSPPPDDSGAPRPSRAGLSGSIAFRS